nr:unnamed protein product [Callosobruchus analis]
MSLENVQRQFLKYLWLKLDHACPARGIEQTASLVGFDMQPLELRRINFGLSFLHKLANNRLESEYLLSKLDFMVPKQNSGRCPTFYLSTPRTNIQCIV